MGIILIMNPNLLSERGALFIDGGYFNKILRKYFDNPSLDYLKLSDNIFSDLNL